MNGRRDPVIERLLRSACRDAELDGAGVSVLSSRGAPEPLYSSDDVAGTIERLQVTLGEGPCIDAAGAMTLAQAVRDLTKPRETFVQLRGDFLSAGPQVDANTLSILPPLVPRGERPDRLDMARWLMHHKNPLTARIAANRLWQHHFGRGLVFTSDDFGTQGDPPSHPDLLDWLGDELRSGGWHMKALHRLIVTSATYRQSAAARPELLGRDQVNMWLAAKPHSDRSRNCSNLALSVSGKLNPAIGGPSVRPPQPPRRIRSCFCGADWIC